MAETCPHGFTPGTCLICQTLGVGHGGKGATPPTSTTTLERDSSRQRHWGRRQNQAVTGTAPAERVAPDAVTSGSPARSHHGLHLLGVLIGLAVIAIAAFALVGVVLSFVHVLELVAIGVGAAWGGYHVGYFRASRQTRR